MQQGNRSLGMLKNVQFVGKMFTLSHAAYITVDFKKLASDLFQAASSLVESKSTEKKNEAIRTAPKHNSSLETFPYLIRKHLAMHQSDFTLQIPSLKSVESM